MEHIPLVSLRECGKKKILTESIGRKVSFQLRLPVPQKNSNRKLVPQKKKELTEKSF